MEEEEEGEKVTACGKWLGRKSCEVPLESVVAVKRYLWRGRKGVGGEGKG